MRPIFHALVVFAISIASLSAGNLLLKQGMDRFGALTASGVPTVQALAKVPQLPAGTLDRAVHRDDAALQVGLGRERGDPDHGPVLCGHGDHGQMDARRAGERHALDRNCADHRRRHLRRPLGDAGDSSMIQLWYAATALVGILVLMGLASVALGSLAIYSLGKYLRSRFNS